MYNKWPSAFGESINCAEVWGSCIGVAEHPGLLESYTLSLVAFFQTFRNSGVLSPSRAIKNVKAALLSSETSVNP